MDYLEKGEVLTDRLLTNMQTKFDRYKHFVCKEDLLLFTVVFLFLLSVSIYIYNFLKLLWRGVRVQAIDAVF